MFFMVSGILIRFDFLREKIKKKMMYVYLDDIFDCKIPKGFDEKKII